MKEKTPRVGRGVSSTRTMHISACWNSTSYAQVDVYRTLDAYFEQCDLWTFRGTSSLSGDVPLCAGEYEFNFQIAVDVPLGQSFPTYFKASIGTDTVINESTIFGNYGNQGPLYTPWNLPPYANPLPSRFRLNVGENLLYENPLTLSINNESDCGYDSWDPARDPVSINIVSGADYVSWHDMSRAKITDTVVTGLATKINNFLLVADGHLPPDSGATVVLEASSNGVVRTSSVLVKPYHISVLVDPPLVPVGEKARITLQLADASGAPYSPLLFPYARLRITDSTQYGSLWYGDFWGYFSETGDSLCDVVIDGPDAPLGRAMKFLANEQSPAESVQVHFTVEKTGDCCTIYPRQPWYLYPYDGLDTVRASGVVTVKNNDILLGETKYYQATMDPFDYSTVIKEYNTPQDSNLSDVEFHVDAVSGSKLGVYYEYKDSIGEFLPTDQIRLVGRYWQQDSTYRVKLRAIYGDTASIVVEVKRPQRLGSTNNSVTDVSNRKVNLDSVIVIYAGQNGIPPQLIKGQMQKESAFKPAWRYEPFQDISIQEGGKSKNYFSKELPFIVNETTMGSGDMPTSHSNEDPNPYLGAPPAKIGAFTFEHWSRYVQHHIGDESDIIVGSEPLTERWQELYTKIKNDNGKRISDADARNQAHDALKQEIQDETSEIGESYAVIAQTRKVTSYGLTQMMYITAADNVFNNNHDRCKDPSTTHYVDQTDVHTYPEKLNEQDFLMPCYCDFLWKKLNFTFSTCIPDGDWDDGFESQWGKALRKYNPGEAAYGRDVMANAKHFRPTN